MIGGKAHWKTATGRECALTNEQVRFRTKFASIDSTLRPRRIAWQQIVRGPHLHSQLRTALAGAKRPVANCNPWLKTFWDDVLILKAKCEWTHWRQAVEDNGFLVIPRPVFLAITQFCCSHTGGGLSEKVNKKREVATLSLKMEHIVTIGVPALKVSMHTCGIRTKCAPAPVN